MAGPKFAVHESDPQFEKIRRAVATKAPLRVQFLLTFFGGGGEALALLSKKEGGRGL